MKEISNDEITKLSQVKWKTLLSKQIEEFSEVISNDEVFEKYFGKPFVEKLSSKSKDITKALIKLGVIYTALMLSLFAFHNSKQTEFVFFGYGFKNLDNYKELLLFLAVSISPATAVLTAYQKYLNALVNECLKKLSPNEQVRKFYAHTFLDEYFDGFWKASGGSTNWHGVTYFLLILLGVILLLLFATLLVGSFFIQISVIYDVVTKPSASHYVNLFVISYSITSILFSWLISLIQCPMPAIDSSNYSKLTEIKEEDPDRYEKIMQNIANENSKREAISLIVSSSIIYISLFTIIAIFWFSSVFDNVSLFIGKSMSGAFIVLFLSNEIIGFVRKRVFAWFFRKYRYGAPNRLRVFGNVKKTLRISQLVISSVLSICYAFYVLSH